MNLLDEADRILREIEFKRHIAKEYARLTALDTKPLTVEHRRRLFETRKNLVGVALAYDMVVIVSTGEEAA